MNESQQLIRDKYTPLGALTDRTLTVASPWDLKPIAEVAMMDEAEAFMCLARLKQCFDSRKMPRVFERIEILKKAARSIAAKREAYADLISFEGGKPRKDALVEVDRAVVSIELAAEEASRWHGTEMPMRRTKAASGHLAFTIPDPIGVVFSVSAFNHPLNLIAHQVAPAIAAGCPVLIKPALETPLSCLHFVEALYDAGLPEDMCLALIADNAVSEAIVRSPQIAFFSFIGSAKVGWHLRTLLAPGVRFSLEHGGSAPAIVDASADLSLAIPSLVKGGYYHAGQVCVSTQRVFVHEGVWSEFRTGFEDAVKLLKTGDPRLPEVDCGPIISNSRRKTVFATSKGFAGTVENLFRRLLT